ncbi:MAG: helicase-related protein [Albidovulum sp.]|nr:helicase-related protein [Albidovulum sp.]
MPRRGQVSAVTGPTNTGKTWYAIERMLGHRSGMIGLPLRLLAREVYDRVVKIRGPSVAALVTGEERIIPPMAKYWICTVEAMPLGTGADFLAVDEIQLCSDAERGHVFTDRLLRARGLAETLFLGSDTMRGAIGRVVPGVKFRRRDRFSSLVHSGPRKISRLQPRSAIVGFSAESVYSIAELIRRHRGGAAVVMGALSPRTRNAQVSIYQNGDVDFLVATDAIGMGLNLDIAHVAFAGLSKFDGRRMRSLASHELAQIAGRAGRHMSSGTFGTTAEAPALDPAVAERIEENRFAPVERLQWRNSDLEFGSPEHLIASLDEGSDNPLFARAREADDLIALRELSSNSVIRARIANPRDVKLLWEVCQIPDFRKDSASEHAELLSRIFEFVQGGFIPEDWLEAQMRKIDRIDGDVDALSKRIAYVRTWTYVSQRGHWLEDAAHWRERTRALEDRLSDALHLRLTQRFIDLRTSALVKGMKRKEKLVTTVNDKGEVTVEGQFVGRLEGFRFFPDPGAAPEASRAIKAASAQALVPELILRSQKFSNAPNNELGFTEQGGLMWGDVAVGKLVAGADALAPQIEAFADEEAGEEVRSKVERRLRVFVDHQISSNFEHLIALRNDTEIAGISRGFAFRLIENLGIVNRWAVAEDVKALDQEARKPLRAHGVRFGQYSVYLHSLLKPAPTRLRILLWSLFKGIEEFPPPPPPSLVTIPKLESAPEGYYPLCGFHHAGDLAIRIDMLERLADLLRAEDSRAGFEATSDMLSISGLGLEQFATLMRGLGFNAKSGIRKKAKPPKADNAEKQAEEFEDSGSAEANAAASVENTAAMPDANGRAVGSVEEAGESPTAALERVGEARAVVDPASGHGVGKVEPASEAEEREKREEREFAVPEKGDYAISSSSNGGDSRQATDCEEEEVVFYTFSRFAKRKSEFRREKSNRARAAPDSRISRISTAAVDKSRQKPAVNRVAAKSEGFGSGKTKGRKRVKAPNEKRSGPSSPSVEIDPDSPFAVLMSLKKRL